ncbi:hemerythrin domain-containing protein [Psychrobacter frigidicola]|uniref:Hemerythrin domain-containing protein n=1 Tax=Psychrobacter frigidicola TaxID=45611 RepID=A0A5C7A2U8_9GAMM|nr:hemerythrin domain-containing protein [Psychrobacter frigidicola]TXD97572.1 hemerythrin domain-containing protein [Psychrobacter frigidicola]
MKRANQLQPLSRQHHLGLNLSHHAKACIDDPKEITKHWQILSSYLHDMQYHFRVEDNLIVKALLPYQSTQPEVASVLDTLEKQHKLLNEATGNVQMPKEIGTNHNSVIEVTVTQVRQLANILYDHVRFEERELFPIVEKYLTKDELDAIYKASPDKIKHLDEQR